MTKIDAKQIQAELAAKFISLIEAGNLPEWRKSWRESGGARKCGDGYLYAGMNQLRLQFIAMERGWPSIWGTPNQFATLAKSRGEVYDWKGKTCVTQLLTPNLHKFEVDDKTTKTGKRLVVAVRSYSAYPVLNIAQVKGTVKLGEDMFKHAGHNMKVDAFLNAQGAQVVHKEGDAGYYTPETDVITLPHSSLFDTIENYYAVHLHELIHWTGHEKRLNRKGVTAHGGFGTDVYAYEELIAELGACMTGALIGATTDADPANHAAYLLSWVRMLREKPSILTKASGEAFKAMTHLAVNAGIMEKEETEAA